MKNKLRSIYLVFIFLSTVVSNLLIAKGGFSGGLGIGMPVGGLSNWYSITPKLTLTYYNNPNPDTRVLVETHFQKFTHGSIEDREFQWLIDYEFYSSPEAEANMSWNDFILKIQQKWHRFDGLSSSISPFFSYGFGLYNYAQKVSGLVYPGQSTTPLDQTFLLDTITDRRVAWGALAGVGGDIDLGDKITLIINLEYHATIGYLRAFEDWGLYEVFPIQFLSFDIGVGYDL